MLQAAQALTETEIDSKSCRSVKIKRESYYFHSFKKKKSKVPLFIFGGGCLGSRGLYLVAFYSSVPWVLC